MKPRKQVSFNFKGSLDSIHALVEYEAFAVPYRALYVGYLRYLMYDTRKLLLLKGFL